MNSAVIPLRQSAIESALKQASFEALMLPALCLNGSAQILAASRALALLLQRDPEHLVGRHLSEVLGYRRHRDFARRWAGFWARLHENDRLLLRSPLRLAGGITRPFELQAQRLRGEHDGVALVTLRDLSAERAQRRVRQVRTAIADALLVAGGDAGALLDAQRRIVLVKGPHAALFGNDVAQPGVVLESLFDQASGPLFVEAFQRALAATQPGPVAVTVALPAAGIGQPARELDVRLHNRLADVQVGGVICVLRDITERRVLVLQTERMRRRLRTFVEHAADLTLVLDTQGIVHFQSAATRALLGTRSGETVGRPVTALFEPAGHTALQALVRNAAADRDRRRHACLLHARSADGRRMALWFTLRNLGGEEAIGGLLATAVEIGPLLPETGTADPRNARRVAMRERLLDQAIAARLDFPTALSSVLRACGEALDASMVAFWRATHDPETLHCEASFDPQQGRFVRTWIGAQIRRELVPALFARLADRQPLSITDLRAEGLTAALADEPNWNLVGGLLLAPVLLEGEVRGVLTVHQPGPFAWDQEDTAFIGSAALMVALAMEGAQRQQAENRLEQLAWYDALTGLPNRNLLRENLRDLIMTAGTRRRRIALMLIDLDRFKDVNDALGHVVGDALIKSAAQVLKETVGDAGTVARLGGDEFVVTMREFVHRQEVALLAARIAQALHRTDLVPLVDTQVSASIGIALFPEHGREISTLLKNADAAMYQAKRDGRNQFSFFNPIRAERAAREVQLGIQLLKALQAEQSQFRVEYQPQVEMASGRVIGLEALIRWQHPTHGLLTPDHFIGVAEVSGLSDRVTRWVLNEVCSQIVAWRRARPGFDIPVSINVAGRELGSTALPHLVRSTLAKYQVPPHLIVLEITERTLVSDGEVNNDVMGELATLGVGLSLDDFGTGYSTLGYLKRMPIQALKIDQSFVVGIPGDNDSCAIVHAMLAVARHFKLKVVAEGIENAEQVDYLRSIGCEYAQGYYYARALPAATILGYLESAEPAGPALLSAPGAPT